ncbi:hypothetical protein [Clostridium sp. UBA4548]|uniref:hypothetical protein n=1 Tax=Clostridium sp. UBA4548 TaxID=1946361 RepID=UPI0025C2663E|nr:hypothetical protein [Clostridium sp. UBA4548]
MEITRKSFKYLEGQNSDEDDIAGVIISTFADKLIIGVTERHGGDSEVVLDLENAKELIGVLNAAIDNIKEYRENNYKNEI